MRKMKRTKLNRESVRRLASESLDSVQGAAYACTAGYSGCAVRVIGGTDDGITDDPTKYYWDGSKWVYRG